MIDRTMLFVLFLLILPASASTGDFRAAIDSASDLLQQHEYQRAADTLRAALFEAERSVVPDAARGVALNNLGYAYRRLGRCEDATASLTRSLRLLNRGNAPFQTTRRAAVNYFATLLECGDGAGAMRFWTKTLEPMLQDPRGSSDDYAALSAAGGAAFLSQKRYSNAEPLLDEAIATLERSGPAARDRLTVARSNRAVTRCFLGRMDEAMADAEAARNGLEQLDPYVKATVLNDIGLCFFLSRRFAEAEPYFESAVSLVGENTDSPAAVAILANYADLLRKTGRKQAAKSFDLRAREAARRLPEAGRRTVDVGELSSFK